MFSLCLACSGKQNDESFSVSDNTGSFTLTDVPPGNYTVEVWHETLGKLCQKVAINTKEEIVPPQQSLRLFNAALEPKRLVMVPGADHNDYALIAGNLLIEEVVRFVAAVRLWQKS